MSTRDIIQAAAGSDGPVYQYLAVGGNTPVFKLMRFTDTFAISTATTYNLPSTCFALGFRSDGYYLACGTANVAPYITLLYSSKMGSLALSSTYTPGGVGAPIGRAETFANNGLYFAATTNSVTNSVNLLYYPAGLVQLAANYSLPGASRGAAFSPNGYYLANVHTGSPFFTLLNHSTPGSLSLAATYTLSGTAGSPLFSEGRAVAFSPNGYYIAAGNNYTPFLTLLNHTTPGSVSLATTYNVGGNINSLAYSPNGNYLAVFHSNSPYFTLLNSSTGGSLSLATTYTVTGGATGGGAGPTICFTPDGYHIGLLSAGGQYLVLLSHNAGSVSYAGLYDFGGSNRALAIAADPRSPSF